jgi:hyperosmotically inducible periplasmic protein
MQTGVVLLSLLCLLAFSGCSLAGRTFGRYVDDQAVTGAVKLRLAAQQPATVARINVDTYEGIVYLSGTAESEEQKSYAEIAARRVEGVQQVVNDLQVRGTGPSASPAMNGHGLIERLPGIARLDAALPGAPGAAYDRSGRLVATVYTVSMRELAQDGFQNMRTTGRPIDHVSIFPIATAADRPEPEYHLVLWHVSATEAAALR